MTEPVLCQICHQRRARRACPAVAGDICTLCCGSQREVTLSCPLDCPFLVEAHKREKPAALPEDATLPYDDVDVTEAFLVEREELLLFAIYSLLQAALHTPGAVDTDVLAALDAMIRTHRTLESGLVYESRPSNLIAAEVQRAFERSLADYTRLRREDDPLHPVRDSDISRVLVFLYRIGSQNQNGRPRGRLFLSLLRHMTPDRPAAAAPSSAIIL